jgi:hypothetical protein
VLLASALLRVSIALAACRRLMVSPTYRSHECLQVVDMELQRHRPTALRFTPGDRVLGGRGFDAARPEQLFHATVELATDSPLLDRFGLQSGP